MPDTHGGALAIVNVRVFDGLSAELVDGPVRTSGGLIVSVGADVAESDRVLDAQGGTVVPGLIDAHFHAYAASLDFFALENSPTSYVTVAATRRLEAALSRGFTTVRDVAGGDLGLARAIDEGLCRAPRYLFTGRALTQTGGHGDSRPGDWDVCGCTGHMAEIVDGVDAVRKAVRERFRRGAHAIKVMASGGVVSPTDPLRVPQYSTDELRAACEEASRRNSYVAAHAYSPEAIHHAVTSGVRSIEHGNLLDERTAELMADHEAFLVPTLATYDAMGRRGEELGLSAAAMAKNREVLDAGQRSLQLARDKGVRIAFGTDLMGSLETEQLEGLRLQIEALGVLDGLRSATSVGADLLGRPDLGRVIPGAAADLLVLDGDPFTEPSVLWDRGRHTCVIQNGERLS